MDERWWRFAGPAAMVVAAGIGVLFGISRVPDQVPSAVAEAFVDVATTPPAEIVVHVAGAVLRPGLVRVPSGSRVAEAIAAAGGVTADARLDAVNLAAPISDGAQIVVPDAIDAVTPSGGGQFGDGLIHLNQASASDFETLPGVGPVLAERIVSHRDANGAFGSVDDLLDVPGIGEAKLASLRELVAP